jgi:hypothetical protein
MARGEFAVVVQRGAADARDLRDGAVLREIPHPGPARAVGRAEPQDAVERAVLIDLEMSEVALAVRVMRARFEDHHVESASRQLLGYDRAASARPYDDDVTHRLSSGF